MFDLDKCKCDSPHSGPCLLPETKRAQDKLLKILSDKPRRAADLPTNLRRLLRAMEYYGLVKYDAATFMWSPTK